MQQFDALVVGAGQAGVPLAQRLARNGMQVALIERHRLGGTCVNTGCIPTKTMIASAYAAHVSRRGSDYGVVIDVPVRVDLRKVKARKDEVSGASRASITKWLAESDNLKVVYGHARFVSERVMQVGEQQYSAPRIFLNVGTRPLLPPMPGLDSVNALTNATLMQLEQLPEHLVIVGGSYIGLEFGQMFRRFGSRVTIVEKGPRLISREDADISQAIREIFEGEGIDVRLDSNCIALEPRAGGVAVRARCDDADVMVEGTHVLIAVGRKPNTDDLDAGRAGIEIDARGYIRVDDELRSTAPGVWALGDCNGRGAFTHTSYNDFEIVAANALEHAQRRVSDRISTYALFTDPPLGRAGMTDDEARKSGRRLLTAMLPMSRVGRAVERGESLGFMKVLVDADSGQLLGAAILGLNGDEVIHALLDAMYARAPAATLTRAMHIHPTVAEFIPTLLGQLVPLD
jgi:pyruvate/2-oxoglutarate dehydrogenase complex dihydrolipoamide dehydrogenase (E3) component